MLTIVLNAVFLSRKKRGIAPHPMQVWTIDWVTCVQMHPTRL